MEKDDEEVKSVEFSTAYLVTRNAFQRYFQKWDKETRFTSSNRVMFDNENYQAIINMGWDAVPHIIEQLRKKPTHLFWALDKITQANPIKPEHIGHVREMAADYIAWYDNLKYKG
jgi:hypothetical protein